MILEQNGLLNQCFSIFLHFFHVSRIFCFWPTLPDIWLAIVSATFEGLSESLRAVVFSAVTLLLVLTKSSKREATCLDRALSSLFISLFSEITSILASRKSPDSLNSSTLALFKPSTKTFTVPSGNFSNWRTFPKVPTS